MMKEALFSLLKKVLAAVVAAAEELWGAALELAAWGP